VAHCSTSLLSNTLQGSNIIHISPKAEKATASEAEKSKSTAAEKPEASAQVEANKEFEHAKVEGTIKQGQQLGSSQIKVQNQQIDTGPLHTTPTKESARELETASQAKVEKAPTTPSGPSTREEKVILLYKEGRTFEDIAKEMQMHNSDIAAILYKAKLINLLGGKLTNPTPLIEEWRCSLSGHICPDFAQSLYKIDPTGYCERHTCSDCKNDVRTIEIQGSHSEGNSYSTVWTTQVRC